MYQTGHASWDAEGRLQRAAAKECVGVARRIKVWARDEEIERLRCLHLYRAADAGPICLSEG